MNQVTLTVAGSIHGGWKSVQIQLSMESLSGAFQLVLTDKWSNNNSPNPQPRTIKPGDSCTVQIDGNTVITGYIDSVRPNYDGFTHGIIVEGRDKAGDLVDCSIINAFEFKNLKIEQIVTRICEPFGIPVKTTIDTGQAIPTFNIEQGMSAFEGIEKACRMRQALAISDGRGGITITRAGTERATTSLVEGQNILAAEAQYDFTDRFSQYICKGQKQGSDNTSTTATNHNKGVVNDEIITRYRPLLIIADGQADTKNCIERAKWEATIRQGKSRRLAVSVVGWTQADGTPWAINKVVGISSPLIAATDNLLIAGLNFVLDERGQRTELALTSPESYAVIDDTTIKKKKGKSAEGNPYIEG